jgi:protein SCO1/2
MSDLHSQATPRPARRWRGALLMAAGMLAVAAAAMALDGESRRSLRQLVATAADVDDQEASDSGHRWGADHFPNVVLTDQHGRPWRLYDDLLKGKTVAVNSFFTVCADVCPLGTAKMLELQRLLGDRMGRDIVFYSLSVDPLRDSPEAMKAYAERYGVGPGWLFLTGSEADLRLAARKLGLGRMAQTAARETHSNTLTVGHEPTGRWMKNAATDNPQFLASHLATFLGWPADTAPRMAEARPLHIGSGEFLFRNGCAACHGIGAGSAGIGPDLADVTKRRPRAWLERFILMPDVVIAEGDPVATALLAQHKGVRMPNLGLTQTEVGEILSYIDTRSARVRQVAAGNSGKAH